MTSRTVLMTADAVGGVWRYVVDLGGALTKRGAYVIAAVMGPPPSDDDRREAERAGVVVISRPYRLEWMDDPWDDVQRAGEWLMTLERMVRPDVVHLNGYAHATLQWGKPVLVVAHSCVRTWWRAVKKCPLPETFRRYTEAVKAGLLAADAVVTPSAAMRVALELEYGIPLDAIVIPNGQRASAAMPADPRAKEDLVLAAGRAWDEAKNIASLCDVAPELPCAVCVAGDRTRPDGTTCELPNVRVLGRLPQSELAAWYARAAIYALPVRYEPFGLSILEAASAGCALVLGDIDSLREHWDGAAMFVPPDDRRALLDTIRELIASRDHRALLGTRAKARATKFTIDRTAAAYVRVYDRLTRHAPGASGSDHFDEASV